MKPSGNPSHVSLWISDLAANLLAVLIVVVLVLARIPDNTPFAASPIAMTGHLHRPLRAVDMVDMLYERVKQNTGNRQLIDLIPTGLRPVEFQNVQGLPQKTAYIFVLSPENYRTSVELLGDDIFWQEMAVPEALMLGDDWAPEFLALAATSSASGRAEFEAALTRFLQRGMGGRVTDEIYAMHREEVATILSPELRNSRYFLSRFEYPLKLFLNILAATTTFLMLLWMRTLRRSKLKL